MSDLTKEGTYKSEPKDISKDVDLSLYFPDTNKYKGQKLSDKSLYSLSKPAETIETLSDIINIIKLYNIGALDKLTITDATAHVGGSTISFAKVFGHVNAIELDHTHFNMLENNLKVYGLKNVSAFNDDYLNVLSTLKQDIVFIDPPFGGPGYWKKNPYADYYLGNTELSKIVSRVKAKLICLKVGINFNYTNFVRKRVAKKLFISEFKGYSLIIIYNPTDLLHLRNR